MSDEKDPRQTDDPSAIPLSIKDPERFAQNISRVLEGLMRAGNAFLKPREDGRLSQETTDDLTEVMRTLAKVVENWTAEPGRGLQAQSKLYGRYFALGMAAMSRMNGIVMPPVVEPEPRDKRFLDPQWSSNAFFDLVKQFYLITVRWAEEMVDGAEGLEPHDRLKAQFYVRQIASALSPSNFLLTNPEVLRETLDSSADNLVRGVDMLVEDIVAGKGNLRIRQTDASKFEIGRNIAVTPGKVIYENALCQLIQYKATTPTVLKRPLLIVPPWINKFYILDLGPEKSFIKWAVAQGHTVFVVSWVNPDARHSALDFDDYMRQGILDLLDVVNRVCGTKAVNVIGYCVGGTLLGYTLAHMANEGDTRIASATLLAAQVDFSLAGDLKVFMDEEQIAAVERRMAAQGYLDGKDMAAAFNMLRPNDLIWPYVVNNYFRGRDPFPFDLLYWNSDATRMAAKNHSFYLRACYLENRLATGRLEVAGEPLSLSKVKVPVYSLATKEDHIAPARSVLLGTALFGGDKTFVLSGSGHIAGVINPPERQKYQYWTGPAPKNAEIDTWLAKAKEHKGSWWPHWQAWVEKLDGERVKARAIGGRKVKPIEDAPGSYVRVMAE